MNSLLTFILQSVVCSMVFYAVYYLVLRNESCYGFNRYYLLAATAFSVLFPLVKVDSPLRLSDEVAAVVTLPEMVIGDPYAASYTSFSWLKILYAVGILFFSVRLLVKLIHVIRLVVEGRKERQNGYILVPTHGKLPTFSFMSYLFWDETQPISEADKQQILDHELAHITKRHSYDILLMEILHAIMWFNPLMYAVKNSLVMTHEFEADDKAIGNGPLEEYQRLLAQQVLNQYGLALGSHFNQSQTLKRLRMLTNKNNHVYWGRFVLPVLAIVMVFAVISCEHPAMGDEEIVIKSAAVSGSDTGNEVFTVVEDQPYPPGGMQAFYTYVGRELKYPNQARQMGIEGKVFVQFIVDADGTVTDVQTIKGIGAGCDLEARRVIEGSPKWHAGKQRGKPVKVRMILPITFRLGNPEGEDRVINDLKIKIENTAQSSEADLVFK